jgi:hypothetical protein
VELYEATETIPILRYKNKKERNEKEQSKSEVRGCNVLP